MTQSVKNKIIAITVVVVIILGMTVVGGWEKLGRFGIISQNIALNLMHPYHGDNRPLEKITATYIKANTGTTKVINEAYLPAALKPIKKYAHPPFAMGACAVCHAPNRSKPAAIVTHTVGELCYKCHEPLGGITARGKEIDCNKCHSPHHADKEKLIRNTVTDVICPAGRFNAEATLPEMGHDEH